MAKRMLVIADSDSFWTVRFLRRVALPEGYEIVLFPIWGNQGKYDDFYAENKVRVYQDNHKLPVIRRIPRVRMWARIWANAQSLLKLGPFDVVHNHYISQRDLALGALVARKCRARWVATIWGSDFLRISNQEKRRMAPLLNRCDHVHNVTSMIEDQVAEVCGEAIRPKLVLADFGQESYSLMDDMRRRMTRADCKRSYGMDPESFVLCIGSSASAAQQQLKTLEVMKTMPEELLRKITIVLQQTYCVDDPDYLQKTHEAAAELPCKTVIMTEFMNDEQCARLRLAADAYIHAIKTDALSSTMLDYLYAGTCVIAGSWLDYPPLDAWNIKLHRFDAFEELPGLIEKAVNGQISGLTEGQRAVFAAEGSWESLLPKWLDMYK